jgi:hypothetical protein
MSMLEEVRNIEIRKAKLATYIQSGNEIEAEDERVSRSGDISEVDARFL